MNNEQINALIEDIRCVQNDRKGEQHLHKLHGTQLPSLSQDIATQLYNAGYRKQGDTIKEFAGKLKSIYSGREKRELHTRISFLFDRIDEIAKEYGAEGDE